MTKFKKNSLLEYIPDKFDTEFEVQKERIYDYNDKKILDGLIIYLCQREIRAFDNWALQFAKQKSEKLNLPLKIVHPKITYDSSKKQEFIDNQIMKAKNNFFDLNLNFEIINYAELPNYLKNKEISFLIKDFNPIEDANFFENLDLKIFEIDSHNIIPARFVSDKQEYNAATLRKKIYYKIYPFLTEFPNNQYQNTEAYLTLRNFINNKLSLYSEFKNDPSKNVVSGLSKYLNLGFISSQRAAIEVLKSDVSDENKEAFLEELIIRKELADNFCHYAKNFKTLDGIPSWAKNTLNFHKYDLRPYLYDLNVLEQAKTHDKLWNASQNQLIKQGVINGYLRMYWCKKILEWSKNPQTALNNAIYLNDKYAFDAPSPNGYTGILWAIGGLHDRAFKDFFITGKIRRMTFNSVSKKFNSELYINKFTT